MAQANWDSLTVDMQHGMVDYQAAVPMMQAISTKPIIPLARVPWLEPGIIMKLLDAGAYGIVCPMINTRAECEAFVGAPRPDCVQSTQQGLATQRLSGAVPAGRDGQRLASTTPPQTKRTCRESGLIVLHKRS